MLNRAQIESCVPHAGTMCLLDAVTHWDATHIVCEAAAPTPDHPLARAGGVPAVAAVEYAAQATAIHGALLDDATPRAGMLAKLSDIELAPGCIDGALRVRAELLSRAESACMYSFSVHDARACCARGRLLVALGGR
jgi:predicted hotdog family 3-hydroxylacyl-ACP dehydratase